MKKTRKKTFYNINFTTNDWKKVWRVILNNLPEGVYVEELAVWKNRNLLEELSKKSK